MSELVGDPFQMTVGDETYPALFVPSPVQALVGQVDVRIDGVDFGLFSHNGRNVIVAESPEQLAVLARVRRQLKLEGDDHRLWFAVLPAGAMERAEAKYAFYRR